MQLAQSPDAGGGLPPQAQTGLPAMAADLGDIAPAPPAAQVLQTAALGDKGAQQADALRAAGQPPPQVPVPVMDTPVAPQAQPTSPELAPEGSPQDLAAAALASPQTWRGIQQQRMQRFQQQMAIQEEERRNVSEFYSTMFDVAAKNFSGRPDIAAAFLQRQAALRGIVLDPNVAAYQRQQIIDGKVTGKQMGDFMGDPNTPIEVRRRFTTDAKAYDDWRKGHAEADKAIQQAVEQSSTNQLKQMDVDTFYDSLEKRVTAEATDRGLRPGSTDFTNYVENRKIQLETEAKRQAFLNTPLTGRNAEDFNQADRAGKFANEALRLINDPTIAGNRGVLEGRLRNAAWRFGFAQSPNEDLYQSISNLSGLMGSKVYSGGIRNMKWIDRVMEHTLRPGDEVNLVKDKINVLLRAAREQQQGIINTASTPIGKLQPTVAEVPSPGGTTPPPSSSSAADAYIQSLKGTTPPPTPQ